MKELNIITVVPADLAFCWEIEVWVESLRKFNLSQKATVLIAYNSQTEDCIEKYWQPLSNKYSEVIFNYFDVSEIKNMIKVYLPIIRPYCLKEYFKIFPFLEEKTIYYIDSDVIFTKKFDFTPYLNDDKIYASDISSYNDHHYFDSKKKDVMLHKQAKYTEIDVLDKCAKLIGINREIIEKAGIMGGCQYILKNIDWRFWEKVQNDCFKVKLYLDEINREYFPNEKLGFQSWCTDLFVVWWNLLLTQKSLSTPKELNFSWATSPIEDWNKNYIFHNSGLTEDFKKTHEFMFFDKSHSYFRSNLCTPWNVEIWGQMNKDFCIFNYWKIIQDMKDTAITKINQIEIVK